VRSLWLQGGVGVTSIFPVWFNPYDPKFMLRTKMGVVGLNKDLVHPSLWSGGTWKSLTWLALAYVIMCCFLLKSMRTSIGYCVDFMTSLSWFHYD